MSSVQRYRPDSAKQLAELEASATPHPWSGRHYQDSLDAGHLFFQLLPANTGVAVVMPVLDEAELLNIFIAAQHQGQGLGRQLLSGTMASLRATGCQRLFLEVRTSNHAARKLYQHCGFIESGLRKNYYPAANGQREDAILMEAML